MYHVCSREIFFGFAANFKGIFVCNTPIYMCVCSAQMKDVTEAETSFTQRLSVLQKRLDRVAHSDLGSKGDLAKVHELIKANLQRSKVIQDQINEAKVIYQARLQ